MLVPIYLELANGNTVLLGRAKITGNTSVERKVPLKGVKEKPRRAIMNYYDDVLASVKETPPTGMHQGKRGAVIAVPVVATSHSLCLYLLEPLCRRQVSR